MKRGTFKKIILIGERFGRLVVSGGPFYERTSCGVMRYRWECRCDCGNGHKVDHGNLLNGSTESCGCYQKESRGKALRKHGESRNRSAGKSGSPEWTCWVGIRARCKNLNTANFKNYGGKGIIVCERWSRFENFLADMGRKPTPRHSLDRENVDGPYSPENCKWSTPEEQAINKSNTIRMTLNGDTKPLVEWARLLQIKPNVLRRRRRNGWTDKKILTTPLLNTSNRIYN